MGRYTHTFELSTNFSYALYHVLATVAHLKRMSEYRVCAIVANAKVYGVVATKTARTFD